MAAVSNARRARSAASVGLACSAVKTVTFSASPSTPGVGAQMPRVSRSTGTPAREAR